MSYLQDKKIKQKKLFSLFIIIVFFLLFFYFRTGIFSGFAYVANVVFQPVLVLGRNLGDKFSNLSLFFISKSSLLKENKDLKLALSQKEARMSNYQAILNESNQLKEILGRKSEEARLVLAAILGRPNQSLYDTFIIDVGKNKNIEAGNIVFALGNVPIGKVSIAYPYSSKVILFSNWREKTEVIISPPGAGQAGRSVFTSITGRGGGNFEMILPRDFNLEKGTEVILPGLTPYVVGIVETIISDPRDSFTKALLTTPVNIFELKFVEVEK